MNKLGLDFFIPFEMKDASLREKYDFLHDFHIDHPEIPLVFTNVFGPFPPPCVPWDISEEEKVVIYNKNVNEVLKWITYNIVVNLSIINYKTLDVLIRIATGMLNKCDIPKELQIMLHDNMVENLRTEHSNTLTSDLPF